MSLNENLSTPHPFEKQDPQQAGIIRAKVQECIEAKQDNLNLGGMELGNGGMDYLAHYLSSYDEIRSLNFTSCELTDAEIPGIVSLLSHSPELYSLSVRNNKFSAEVVEKLCEPILSCPQLREVDFSYNRIGEKAGETVARLIREHAPLKTLICTDAFLRDEGMAPIIKALHGNQSLEKLSLSANQAGADSAHDFIAAIRRNRSLTSVSFNQPLHDPAVDGILFKGFMTLQNPNLIDTTPMNDDMRRFLRFNRDDASTAKPYLSGDLAELDAPMLRFIDARANAIFALPGELTSPNNGESRRETYLRYENFMRALPKIPKAGEGFTDALFTMDGLGYTPLDNPRHYRQGTAFLDAVKASSVTLTDAFLANKTPRGSDFLTALADATPPEELMHYLNGKGVQLGAKQLLDAKGKPSPLMHAIIQQDGGAELFSVSNWQGREPKEMRSVYEALPAAQKDRVNIHTLQRHIVDREHKGVGR